MSSDEFINAWIYNCEDITKPIHDYSGVCSEGDKLIFNHILEEEKALNGSALIPKEDIHKAFMLHDYGIEMNYSYGFFDHRPYHTSVGLLYQEVADLHRYLKMWLLLLLQDSSKDYFRCYGKLAEKINEVYFKLIKELGEDGRIYFGNAKNMLPEGSYKTVLAQEDIYVTLLFLQNRMNYVKNHYYLVVYDDKLKVPSVLIDYWDSLMR